MFAMFGENEADPDKGVVAVVGGLNTTAANVAEPRRLDDLRLQGRGRRAARQPARLHDPAVRREEADRPLRGVVHDLQAATSLETTIADLTAGNVPGQVVSYLQSHPDVKYVNVAIGDLATGLPEAIDGRRHQRRQDQSAASRTSTRSSRSSTARPNAWKALPRVSAAWMMVDAMARYDQGMDTTVDEVVADGADLHAGQRRDAGHRLRRRPRLRGPVEGTVGGRDDMTDTTRSWRPSCASSSTARRSSTCCCATPRRSTPRTTRRCGRCSPTTSTPSTARTRRGRRRRAAAVDRRHDEDGHVAAPHAERVPRRLRQRHRGHDADVPHVAPDDVGRAGHAAARSSPGTTTRCARSTAGG